MPPRARTKTAERWSTAPARATRARGQRRGSRRSHSRAPARWTRARRERVRLGDAGERRADLDRIVVDRLGRASAAAVIALHPVRLAGPGRRTREVGVVV